MGNWPYIISATKVKQHIKCERLPFMDAHRDPKEAVDPQERLLAFDLGVRHEEEVGQRMRAGAYGPEASVPVRLSEIRGMEAAKQTLDDMRAEHASIEQGLLIHDNWWGAPDWLHRRSGSSNFGEWYYEPGDAKLGGRKTTIRSQVVPVTFYALILERIQGFRPTHFTIYRTTPAVVDVSKHVDDALDVVKKLERVLGDGDDPGPWLTSECAKCKWVRACKADARRTAHLSLITGMRRDLLPRLNALGIGTVNDLAKLPAATIERLPHIGGDHALRVLEQAKVYADHKPRIVGRPRIPPRTKTEIYLDIEGQGRDNMTDAVLFGLLIRRGSRMTCWTSLANSPTDGRRAWREFCQHLRTLPRDCPVFHFGTYDAQLVRGLQAQHGGAKDHRQRTRKDAGDPHRAAHQSADGAALPLAGEVDRDGEPLYFYCVDRDFGPFFLKYCSYFPYNGKLCINGHEYLKQQSQKGTAYEALDNGILSCADRADPDRLKAISEGLSAEKIDAVLRKWLRRPRR